jgi:hypothetical protein
MVMLLTKYMTVKSMPGSGSMSLVVYLSRHSKFILDAASQDVVRPVWPRNIGLVCISG